MSPDTHAVRRTPQRDTGGRKRTRTPLACDICRERKVRCNGAKPICGRCQVRGLTAAQCVYSTTMNPSRNDSQREYINVLHDRIRHLEASRHSADHGSNEPYHPTLSDRSTSLSMTCQLAAENNMESSSYPVFQSLNFDTDHTVVSKPSQPESIRQDSILPTLSEERPSAAPLRGVSMLLEEPDREAAARTPSSSCHCSDSATVSSKPPGSTPAADREGQFNAMGVIYSMESPQQSPSQTFYGQSSVASLLNQIPSDSTRVETSRHQANISQLRTISKRDISCTSRKSMLDSSRRIRWSSLPPRHVADDLLDHYWSSVHLYYPWIHTQSFLKAYEKVWAPVGSEFQGNDRPRVGLGGSDCSDTIFNLALNAIFALGCKFLESLPDRPEDPASEFMDRTFILLHVELLDEPSLSLVQALVLIALYLQSTQQVMKCWSIAGLACRMAQGIGLHLSHHDSEYTFLELEMRRRAWHGCMLLDRIVSMTFGRLPVLLGGPKVPLFSAIDDEYLKDSSEPCFQSEGKFSRVAFAVENVKLGWILGDILQQLYGIQLESHWGKKEPPTRSQLEQTPNFDSLVLLESNLSEFESNLPKELTWRSHDLLEVDAQLERAFLRQKYVLRARLLHVRLMLYRPSFCKFCASPASNETRSEEETRNGNSKGKDIGSTFAFHCAVACVSTASELIELLFKAVTEDLFGAWWYALYYLVSCDIILIMAETSTKLNKEFDEGRLTELWQSCHRTLEVINLTYPITGQCAVALETIRKRSIKIRQSTASKCGLQDEDIRTKANDNQAQQPSGEPQTDMSASWGIRSPTQDAFASLNEIDIEQINREAGGISPMFEGLQASYGSAFLPSGMWEALDMESSNGLFPFY